MMIFIENAGNQLCFNKQILSVGGGEVGKKNKGTLMPYVGSL